VRGVYTRGFVFRATTGVTVVASVLIALSIAPAVQAHRGPVGSTAGSRTALIKCGTIKGPFGAYKNVRVSGMSCKAAKKLIEAGGPVQAHYKCTFKYTATTFTPTCHKKTAKGTETITYTGRLAGGKA
jgi:hypothetical protein